MSLEGLGHSIVNWLNEALHLVPADVGDAEKLFSVSDFLAALALLLVVYTVSDFRYKLRLSLSAIPIYRLAFWIFGAVFVLKVAAELWFYNSLPIVSFLNSPLIVDGVLLTISVAAVFLWISVSFVYPPKFNRLNHSRFFHTYRRIINNGTDEELRSALSELIPSIPSIVKAAGALRHKSKSEDTSGPESIAHDFLLLMGNRRFCSEVVASTPDLAAHLFSQLSEHQITHLPVATVVKNLATEFLTNDRSPMLHEDSGWESGWSGYAQPFSNTIFADVKLIQALTIADASPFQQFGGLGWRTESLAIYTRVACLYISRLLEEGRSIQRDRSAIQIVLRCKDFVRISPPSLGPRDTEFEVLRILVKFVTDVIDICDDKGVEIVSPVKPSEYPDRDFFHRLAELSRDLVFETTTVKAPADQVWGAQYITVWSGLFVRFKEGKNQRWLLRSVSRLIYDKIRDMDRFYNFEGARYLGFCLNVLGLNESRDSTFREGEAPLRLAVLAWTKRHYIPMLKEKPRVAEAVLSDALTFDSGTGELVKTFAVDWGHGPRERRFSVIAD